MKYETNSVRWPGYIETGDYLKFSQLVAWEKALDAGKALKESAGVGEYYETVLPVCISFVTKWHIVGLNVDADGNPILAADGKPLTVDFCNFPASGKIVSWLVNCISQLYTSTNESDPN